MDSNRDPASAPEPVLPKSYQQPPPSYSTQNTIMLTALPPHRAPNTPDWLGLIPNYHKYLGIKLFLAGMAAAVSIVALALNKTFTDKISPHRNTHTYLHSDSIAYGAVCPPPGSFSRPLLTYPGLPRSHLGSIRAHGCLPLQPPPSSSQGDPSRRTHPLPPDDLDPRPLCGHRKR